MRSRAAIALMGSLVALGASALAIGCGGSKGHGGAATTDPFKLQPTNGTSLAPAAVGVVYSQTFVVLSGGLPPYTFTPVSLPPGLVLGPIDAQSVSLSGTPTTPSNGTVTFQVVDSTNADVENVNYGLTITR